MALALQGEVQAPEWRTKVWQFAKYAEQRQKKLSHAVHRSSEAGEEAAAHLKKLLSATETEDCAPAKIALPEALQSVLAREQRA